MKPATPNTATQATDSKADFQTFSPEILDRMEKAMYMINQLTLINNEKIKRFRERSGAMSEDLQELATIVSMQMTVLDEKYKVMYDLITDLYTKVDRFQKGS